MPMNTPNSNEPKYPFVQQNSADSFTHDPANPYADATPLRPYGSHRAMDSVDSQENLVRGAAPLGGVSGSPPSQPTVPNLNYGGGYRGMAY